jgi:tRNA A-37 threonylcarbamoyl transferase component Bud32
MTDSNLNTNTPDSPLDIEVLNCQYSGGSGGWEELFDYGGFRYHLRLNPSNDGKGVEDLLLRDLGKAVDEGDDDDVEHYAEECRTLMWPLLKTDYSSRPPFESQKVIRIQGKTVEGVVQPREHNNHLKYPLTNHVPNSFPLVPTFANRSIMRLEELAHDIFKVAFNDQTFCMKTVHRTGNDRNFVREVSVLQHCSHPNIISLFGIVIDDDAAVEAMLIEYIPTAMSLQEREKITVEEFNRWRKQIKEAIDYLHSKGYVWGDAKPSNVLIRENGDIVLIDFGGGATSGWVSKENYESVTGDIKAWERIVEFLRKKVAA